MAELLLYNGFSPLRRSAGDVFLDNGMGLLCARLRKEKIDYILEDKITIHGFERFNNKEISGPLRRLFEKVLFNSEGRVRSEDIDESMRLYGEMIGHQEYQMGEYLRKVARLVSNERIPVVGIKLWIGNIYSYCVKLCEMIHEACPETLVVVGGPQANCLYLEGAILKNSPFDLAVYEEGEEALIRIVKVARKYDTKRERIEAIREEKIPNLIYRLNGGVVVNQSSPMNINEKMIPEYENTDGKVGVHTVLNALGCDYGKCSFCIHPIIFKEYRMRRIGSVVEEIEKMIERGIGTFTFTASDTPIEHAVEMSNEIIARNIRIEYFMLMRAQKNARSKKKEILREIRTMIRGGLRMAFIGVESGNDEILREVVNKGLSKEDIVSTIECIREASRLEGVHVYIVTSYIFPTPITNNLLRKGITNDKVFQENLELMRETNPDSLIVTPGILYPGTNWYKRPEKYNIELGKEKFVAAWSELEISFHSFIKPTQKEIYSFLGKSIQEWIPASMSLARAGNELGIPTDMMDDQIVLARASGYETREELMAMSKEIFLDIVTCNDENTRHYYDKVNQRSREIAALNSVS